MRGPRQSPLRPCSWGAALVGAVALTLSGTWAQQCLDEGVLTLAVRYTTNSTGHPKINARLEQPSQSVDAEMDVQVFHSNCQPGEASRKVLTLTCHGSAPRAPAPPGYTTLPGLGHFRVGTVALSWEEARSTCAGEGTALAALGSQREAEALMRFFALHASGTQYPNLAWLGATDAVEEGKFVTLAGLSLEEAGYAKWNSGEPNGGRGESCLAFDRNSGFFIDAPCSWKFAYICKALL